MTYERDTTKRAQFGEHLIPLCVTVNCFPRSYDLTPQGYILWGNLKSLVYMRNTITIAALEPNIRRLIGSVLEKVFQNW